VRVQHDGSVTDVGILRHHRTTLGNIVRDQRWRNRYVYRVSRLGQRGLEVAVDKVTHNQVTRQRGKRVYSY
jgi:hypothetical protein